jgi:glycine/D-amino acid oxidase-like deaminating enzyme
MLAFGAVAAASATMPFAPRAEDAPVKRTQVPLPKFHVTTDQIIGARVGLRPFRPSGFVVKSEPFGDKTLIHNYGHGGCGVTLSWGTADMAAKLALATPHRQAAIIGCGVIGLTTARLLQDRGFTVAIYAASLPPSTTSDVAAGTFGVTSLVDEAHQTEEIGNRIAAAARFSFQHFLALPAARYGVKPFDLYLLGPRPIEIPWDFAITPDLFPFETFGPGEHPFPNNYAARTKTFIAETDILLPALLADVRAHGGTIETRGFADMAELQTLEAPLIVNACGIGAKALFGDAELVPVKGQITILKPRPDIAYGYVDPVLDLYMFPRSDGIVLGGSHGHGDWSMESDPERAAQILEGNGLIAGGMRS